MVILHYRTGYCPPCHGKHIDRKLEIGDILIVEGEESKKTNCKHIYFGYNPYNNKTTQITEEYAQSLKTREHYNCGAGWHKTLEEATKCGNHENKPLDKPLKVADGSQPIKLFLMAFFGLATFFLLLRMLSLLEQIVINTSK